MSAYSKISFMETCLLIMPGFRPVPPVSGAGHPQDRRSQCLLWQLSEGDGAGHAEDSSGRRRTQTEHFVEL